MVVEADGALGVRLADVLRRNLGVSRRELEALVEAGRVVLPGADVLRARTRARQELLLRGTNA